MANPSRSFELIRLWPGLAADPGTGKAGEVYFNSTTQSLKYYDGTVWKDFGGTWANQQLSNLIGPTSINADMLPDADLSRNIGSMSLTWAQAYISSLLKVGQVTADDLANLLINTTDSTGSNASGSMSIQTGNTADGPSGGISIKTGLPSGGTSVFDQQNSSFADAVFNFDTSALGVNMAGVSIVAGSSATLSSIVFKLQNATATDDTFITQVLVYDDNAGQPGTLISQSAPVPVSLLGNATADQSYTFSSAVFVTSGQTYYFVLTAQATASTLNLLGSLTNVGSDGWAESTNSGGSWTTGSQPDPYFILYNAPARGNLDLAANSIRFMNGVATRYYDVAGTNYVGFQAPGSLSSDVTWTLPTADGSAQQFLQTDGSGNLSWATVSLTPDFSDAAFRIHSNTDASKLLAFNVTSISASTTRTWTVPDANLNFALGGGSFVARAGDTMTGTLNTQSLIPTTTSVYDLGSNALYFRDIYANDLVRQAQVLVGNGGTTLPSGVSQAYGLNDLNIGSLGTMAVWSQSNNAVNATATGTVRLETGNKTAGTGNSGDIKLRIGTSSGGTRGSLYIADGSEGTVGHVWTSTDATGKGHWAAVPTGANQALSNLTATSINQDLLPQSGYISLFATASGSSQNYAIPDNGTRYAQQFTPTSSGSVAKMDLHVYTYQQPTGYMKIGIYATAGSTPGTLLGYSNDIDVSTLSAFTNGQLITGIFPVSVPIVSGTTYWWSIETSTGYGGRVGSEGSAVGSGPNQQSAWNGSSWTPGGGFLQNATSYYIMYSLAGHSLGSLTAPWDEMFTSKVSVVNGSNKLSFVAPSLSGNTTWTLPAADGSANQFLQTNGAGVLSWGTVSVSPSSITSVRASTTGNITLSSAPSSFDGVSATNGDLILVNNQSVASDNGVYTFNGTGNAMTRATGWTTAGDLTSGRTVWVREGTNRSRMMWTILTSIVTLGTDPVNWLNTGSDSQSLPNLNNIFVPRALGGTNLGSLSNAFGNIYGYGPGGIWLTDGTQVHRWAMGIAGSGSNGAPPYSGTQDLIFTNRTQSLNIVSLNSNGTNATASLAMRTGHQVGGAAATGDLNFITGNHAGSGNSGSIVLGIGTISSGTRGKIKFQDGSEGTSGYVWTSTDATGSGAWMPTAAVTPTVEYRTLSAGEASANSLTLAGTPAIANRTVADLFDGGGPMEYTAEFTVTGTTFDWSGGPYAGVLAAGDRIRIMYWT